MGRWLDKNANNSDTAVPKVPKGSESNLSRAFVTFGTPVSEGFAENKNETTNLDTGSFRRLTDRDKAKLYKYLDLIDEQSAEVISEMFERCRNDPDVLKFFLWQADEKTKQAHPPPELVDSRIDTQKRVQCKTCRHFRYTSSRIGECSKHQQVGGIAGIWSTDKRHCIKWVSR